MVTSDTSLSLQSPSSTPVHHPVTTSMQCVVTPHKQASIPPTSSRTTCLNSNFDKSPIPQTVIMSNDHTPSVAVDHDQGTATMDRKAERELNDTVIIPDSPPIDVSHIDDDVMDRCGSPSLFTSPVKQPLTSTQVNADDETKELNSSSVSSAAEAMDIKEAVKQEQQNTVVSLSS